MKKIIGFRSNVWWKKILSCFYYINIFFILIACLFISNTYTSSIVDTIVVKLGVFMVILLFVVPFLLVFNIFGLRDKLPLFKNRRYILGSIILFIIWFVAIGCLTQLNTPEYRAIGEEKRIEQEEKQKIKDAKLEQEKQEKAAKKAEEDRVKNEQKLVATETKRAQEEQAKQEKVARKAEEDRLKNEQKSTETIAKNPTITPKPTVAPKPTPTPTMTPLEKALSQATKVDYKVLYKDYMENAIGADAKYKGKYLILTGKVNQIDREMFGEPYITFKVADWEDVRITFNKNQEEKVGQFKKGQTISVVGKCQGTLLSTTVALSDCLILE